MRDNIAITSQTSDDELIRLIFDKNEQACRIIIEKYRLKMRTLIGNYFEISEDQKDVEQEIWIKILQNLWKLREGKPFLPWALTLAKEYCLKKVKSESTNPLRHADLITNNFPARPQQIIDYQRMAPLENLLKNIPERQREMLYYSAMWLNCSQIAERMWHPKWYLYEVTGYIRTTRNRARNRLKKLLEEANYFWDKA